MQLAFCLFKYFPFGGLQRDFLRIAQACQARGNDIRVYTLEWRGEQPPSFEVVVVPVRAFSNIARYEKFVAWVGADLRRRPVDRVVGFNKMPGLDAYYAADACYAEKAHTLRNPLYRLGARYRHFRAYEEAVFAPGATTRILMIAAPQTAIFQRHYGTPLERFHLLPPGIARDRRAPPDAAQRRAECRAELGVGDDEWLLLQIGSGFKTKGLDRSLLALAHLPPTLRGRTRLFAIGDDAPAPFLRQAKALGVADRVSILKGRGDIPRVLLAGDLLIHLAYQENTGTVLLEAVVAGLPVLTTGVCGYAPYIVEADAGCVLPEPFAQADADAALLRMLEDGEARRAWARNGLRFAETADIYGNAERAADLILAAP
ncbi:MAG: glycosyltransferase family 4 protein [Dechloromonas sp.]|jgi:UDP-glucose:(heptosyl)LPS alpha-1,3-glucosyltransferase|nr:glycosyltransferase family 4 protein [Dechloromonas sp.]